MATGNNPKALDQLVSDLREAQGDNLASVVLYGATATAEDDHRSDHNVLVVLRSAAFEDLHGCSQALRPWRDAGQPPPVIFTTDELESAADVFPIEFLQMEQARLPGRRHPGQDRRQPRRGRARDLRAQSRVGQGRPGASEADDAGLAKLSPRAKRGAFRRQERSLASLGMTMTVY